MNAKRTFLQWLGHVAGVILFTIVALIPTGIYAAIWWLIPKNLGFVIVAVGIGIIWLIAQVACGLAMREFWEAVSTPSPQGSAGDYGYTSTQGLS